MIFYKDENKVLTAEFKTGVSMKLSLQGTLGNNSVLVSDESLNLHQ